MNGAKRFKTQLITLAADSIALLLAWYVFYTLRTVLDVSPLLQAIDGWLAGVLHTTFWLFFFGLSGLYKNLFLISRLDEFIQVAKTSVYGVLVLFFVLMAGQFLVFKDPFWSTFAYWGLIVGFVGLDRFVIRSAQRFRAIRGRGLHRSLIIGAGESAYSVYQDLERNKTLGHDVIGFVQVNGTRDLKILDEQLLGQLPQIGRLVKLHQVQDVIIALEPEQRPELVKLLSGLEIQDLSIKIVPDFHQVVSGLNKTNQIFGLALIELNPDPMPMWEKAVKRAMDVSISMLFLVLSFPLLVVIALLIKRDSKGPIIFAQKRVGRFGKEFTMYKFRTMYQDAEQKTGPVWAKKDDPRITPIGYWLRKLRLDEIPQFINVLSGSMSLVGPRPERKFFVDQFSKDIPLYTRRLRVKPGITGWAQVKWKYDATLEDVREKTKYDLFYVENRSLRMDLKILINTILVIVKGKGQ